MSKLPENTIHAVLARAAAALARVHASARLDAEVLLAHVLARPRTHLHAWPERTLAQAELAAFRALVRRRAAGEPVAHLTRRREFWSLVLEADPSVLIPRPETEGLVEIALAAIPAEARWRAVDLGTGSGAVALALAHERPACRIIGTDASPQALALAARNAAALGIRNVSWLRADWCAPLAERCVQLVVSNPPYVRAGDPHLVRGDVRFEPHAALVGGRDGLAAIRRIARAARACLVPGGRLVLEHGFDQGCEVRALLRELGYRDVRTHRDLAGSDRVTEATETGSGPRLRAEYNTR